ncbi:hypothetical protein GW846_03375 [Candidatus Gracilibacteria bacterium]|nr:hypothetical protein [Candidatus Gracilibacteria bacterium]
MKIFASLLLTTLIVLTGCASNNSDLEDTVTKEDAKTDKAELFQAGFEGVGIDPDFAFRFSAGKFNWQEPGSTGADSYTATGSSTLVEENQNVVIEAGDFSAILNPDNCTDGVTENEYGYSVILKKGDKEYTGCAREYTK